MTTIFYDGKILAADSRTTRGGSPDHPCHVCGEKTFHHTDNTVKIALGSKDSLFKKEKIIAVGCAGDSAFNRGVRETIKDGRDLETDIATFFRFTPVNFSSTILIVTDKHVWKMSVHGGKTESKKYDLGTPVGCGSGVKAAKTINKYTGIDAVKSLAVAIDMDRYTGGSINYVDTTVKEPKIEKIEAEKVKEIRNGLSFKPIKIPKKA